MQSRLTHWQNYSPNGFTLVEILVGISLVGILAGMTAMVLKPGEFQGRGRDTQREADIETVRAALELYASAQLDRKYPTGTYPNLSVPLSKYIEGSFPNDPLAGKSYEYYTNPTQNCFWLKANLENSQGPSCYVVTGGKTNECPAVCVLPTPTPTPTPMDCWGTNKKCDSRCASITTKTVYTTCTASGTSCSNYAWRRPDGTPPQGLLVNSLTKGWGTETCTGTPIGWVPAYLGCPFTTCSGGGCCIELLNPISGCVKKGLGLMCYPCWLHCMPMSKSDSCYATRIDLSYMCVAQATNYCVSGAIQRYTGTGSCSAGGTCGILTNPGTYYESASGCDASCKTSTYYSNYTPCSYYK